MINVVKSFIEPDGKISTKHVYGISTTCSNLDGMLDNRYIDKYRSETDGVLEVACMYCIEAARHKIIHELRHEIRTISYLWYTIYVDEITYLGHVPSIHKTGLM